MITMLIECAPVKKFSVGSSYQEGLEIRFLWGCLTSNIGTPPPLVGGFLRDRAPRSLPVMIRSKCSAKLDDRQQKLVWIIVSFLWCCFMVFHFLVLSFN